MCDWVNRAIVSSTSTNFGRYPPARSAASVRSRLSKALPHPPSWERTASSSHRPLWVKRTVRLPVVLGVPPAPDHLLAGPRVEDRLGGRLEGALHAQRLVVGHVPGPRRLRRRSRIQARATSSAVPAP